MSDDFNYSDVQADFRDVYKKTITDEVVIKFYNRELDSIKLRFDVPFRGAPALLPRVPAAPKGHYQVVITPTKYRSKTIFYDVEAGKTNGLLQDFFVDPDQARPRLLDFGDIPAKSYAADLQRILNKSGIKEAAWKSLDKRNRATILNLSAKMSREGIADGTKLIKLMQRINRTWLDLKHRERIYFHVDKKLYQSLVDYPAVYFPVSGGMHHFPDGYEPVDDPNSFKTLHDDAGNIQLTFARGEGDDWLADVDLDDHKGLEHVVDVLKHKFSGKDTDPYDIHEILWYFQGLDAEYKLL
jgi:hypothetical protein